MEKITVIVWIWQSSFSGCAGTTITGAACCAGACLAAR